MTFEKPKEIHALVLMSWRCRDIETAMSRVDYGVATLAHYD